MATFMDVEQHNLHKYLTKKNQVKKIYVVAPTKRIFIQWCAERGIHWNNPNVTWISRYDQVLGRVIYTHDEVAFVSRGEFDKDELSRIDKEINMRTKK
jgi:hypothetical protein